MKIQYLGTAAAEGIPAIFCRCDICRRARERGGKEIRARSGCAVNDTVLIDFPPDAYPTSLKIGLDLSNITHLFVTHSHSDHFVPDELVMRMPGCYAHLGENPPPLEIYGNEETLRLLRAAIRREFGRPEVDFLQPHLLAYYIPVRLSNGLTFTYLPALHKLDERAGFFLVEEGEKAFLYAHDTGIFYDEVWDFLKGRKLCGVSLDCNAGRLTDGRNHMGFSDALRVTERLREMGCLEEGSTVTVNHFSHNGQCNLDDLEAMAAPHGIQVSWDGKILEL